MAGKTRHRVTTNFKILIPIFKPVPVQGRRPWRGLGQSPNLR